MGNIRHKSKTEIARRTARCSLRLTEEDLSWVQAQAVLRGCSRNAVFERLIRSARQSCYENNVMEDGIRIMD